MHVPGAVALGRAFPAAGGLVARRQGAFVLINHAGQRAVVEGPICAEIEASLAQAAPTSILTRWAPAHAALEELTNWLATPSVPLTRLDAVRLDGFDTLFLELIGRCNERCVHCYADSAPSVEAALDRATALSVIDQAVELGFRRIQFTGGDPLLCDFLPDAVAHARARGIPHLEIYTNGLALHDDLLAQLAPHRPAFAFSMYSIDASEHDRITRTPGSQRRTLAAIDRVVGCGLELRVSIIVVDQKTDIQDLVDGLRARGVQQVDWTRAYSVGRGEAVAEAGRAVAVAMRDPAGSTHTGAGPMASRRGKLCVTYTGDVVPCIFQRAAVLGNVRDGSLLDLLGRTPTRRALPTHALPVAVEPELRLQCASCRLTERALAVLGGPQ